MHSVVDWGAFAVRSADGGLRRSLGLSPRSGTCEDIGGPLPFERPYWAGERQDDDEHADPWRFHPLDLAEDVLLPHPEPGRLHRGDGWVSVLCPDRTWPQVRELLAVAHDLAVRRVRRR